MLKVFISYSRADADKANIFLEELTNAGMQVFHDKEVQTGLNWRDAIIEGIIESDIGLLLLSPASAQSSYVRREILQLLAQNKRTYAALVSDLGDMELPKFLDDIQYIDLTSSPENLDVLIEAMKNLENLPSKLDAGVDTYTITFRSDDPNKLTEIVNSLAQSGVEDIKIEKAH